MQSRSVSMMGVYSAGTPNSSATKLGLAEMPPPAVVTRLGSSRWWA